VTPNFVTPNFEFHRRLVRPFDTQALAGVAFQGLASRDGAVALRSKAAATAIENYSIAAGLRAFEAACFGTTLIEEIRRVA
jgi:hypothetical protein